MAPDSRITYLISAITKMHLRPGEISFDGPGMISFDSMELYSQSMENYPDYIEHLTENVLEDVTVGEDEVTGNISLDEDKYLVLSIPYQKGWTAYVDGEETELLRANYMYMALPLSARENTASV